METTFEDINDISDQLQDGRSYSGIWNDDPEPFWFTYNDAQDPGDHAEYVVCVDGAPVPLPVHNG